MSFVSPYANLQLMLLNDRHPLPWILTERLMYEYPPTGEVFEIPENFRTDLVSMPKALIALPVVGNAAFNSFFGTGIWKGARESVLHDFLCTKQNGTYPVEIGAAHRIFRHALLEADYPEPMANAYYQAVVAFFRG